MTNSKLDRLSDAIDQYWSNPLSEKAEPYVGRFFSCTRAGNKITGKVKGNHGTYVVSIQLEEGWIESVCSCYIGKRGNCHHSEALAVTFKCEPDQFTLVAPQTVESVGQVKSLTDLKTHLAQITLDDLTKQLRAKGITQKALADSMGMNPQHITAVKSSERRNRYFTELGAIKLACMWVLEHIDE
ncbi:hypothetical protein KFU94_44070 [Chloroflexi bacterium TSY]|nr:hypothetical protein [Chloroflexi bacterium TSY]